MKLTLALLSISSIIFINSNPVNALSKTLYNGIGLPENNSPQWLAPGALTSSGEGTLVDTTVVDTGGVKIDSNAGSPDNAEYSGYSNYNPLTSNFVNTSFPTLDQNSGYSIFFNVALNTISDNSNDRAAFSITVIGKDNEGIEIGFDEDRIFAQNANFTRASAETQSFTTSSSTDYQLAVSGNSYQLLADTGGGFSNVLSGSLRTYDFNPATSDPPLGIFNPYEIPNFLFFGDNTGQAHGTFTLGEISVETVSVPFDVSPTLGLVLIGIGVTTKKLYTQRFGK